MTIAATPNPADLFPFPLDEFQLEAIARLNEGHSVLVCAPTGSGKTVIAEYAVHRALRNGERVFYTTPLKALSNQKFRDFGTAIGEHRVGLLTGDISINRDADVVVMTTEVFRNMLYGTTLGAVEENLRGVRFVVLDEVHYMNDAQRGTVWEESIIYCPPAIQLVALSATVANSDEMAAWMENVHGDTTLITTDYRPVPLRFHFFDGRNLAALFRARRPQDSRPSLPRQTTGQMKPWEMRPDSDALVPVLADKEMLPAIYFVFSRRGCDDAMRSCAQLQLLREEEVNRVEEFLHAYAREYPSVLEHAHLPYLFRGVAAHHAGLLPTWKVLVERLFQAGLVRVVFATETLAAGINMPARTTVISSITKRADRGHRTLTASEFLQMSGRAGRRGMDKVGHVVIVASPYQTRGEAQALASAPPDPLGSHFTPTYGMVLNLLQRHSLEEAQFLISRSFGEFLAQQRAARRSRRRRGPDGERHEKPAAVWGNWQRFLGLKGVLEHFGLIDEDYPTPEGVTAAAFRAEHELLVAEAFLSGALDGLTPAEFAAAATALVSEELRPNTVVRAPVRGAVNRALDVANRIAREIRNEQRRYRVHQDTRIFRDTVGLTQLWAGGTEWDEVMEYTNLDEGDVVRIFRRTVDLLEQVIHAPGLPDPLKQTARHAVDAMDREPVREIM